MKMESLAMTEISEAKKGNKTINVIDKYTKLEKKTWKKMEVAEPGLKKAYRLLIQSQYETFANDSSSIDSISKLYGVDEGATKKILNAKVQALNKDENDSEDIAMSKLYGTEFLETTNAIWTKVGTLTDNQETKTIEDLVKEVETTGPVTRGIMRSLDRRKEITSDATIRSTYVSSFDKETGQFSASTQIINTNNSGDKRLIIHGHFSKENTLKKAHIKTEKTEMSTGMSTNLLPEILSYQYLEGIVEKHIKDKKPVKRR